MYRYLCFIIVALWSCIGYADLYRLAIFGDSLSAGHHLSPQEAMYSQLERKLQDKGYDVKVIHASRNGETTYGGVARQGELLSQNPNGVILELGINDFLFQRRDLSGVRQNLETMVVKFQERNIPVLLVGMKVPPAYPQAAQFEKMYQTIANQYRLSFYPFYMDGIIDSIRLGQPSRYLLSDGLHPNADGVAVMVRNILPTVEQFLNRQGVFAH